MHIIICQLPSVWDVTRRYLRKIMDIIYNYSSSYREMIFHIGHNVFCSHRGGRPSVLVLYAALLVLKNDSIGSINSSALGGMPILLLGLRSMYKRD